MTTKFTVEVLRKFDSMTGAVPDAKFKDNDQVKAKTPCKTGRLFVGLRLAVEVMEEK